MGGYFDSPYAYFYSAGEAIECTARGSLQSVLWLNGERVSRSGTSLAAPSISGIVALFLERYPRANLEEVRGFLSSHCVKMETKKV
jgi:subtilisin family serine protease